MASPTFRRALRWSRPARYFCKARKRYAPRRAPPDLMKRMLLGVVFGVACATNASAAVPHVCPNNDD